MTVRAKFKVDKFETSLTTRAKDPKLGWRSDNLETIEVRTIVMSPVGSNSPENEKFWAATPTGDIRLGTVNPEAWGQFVLGKEVYVDFTPAAAPEQA